MDDTAHIIREEEDISEDEERKESNFVTLPRRLITVEPILALFSFSIYVQAPVLDQYLYYAIGRQYNLTSSNASRAYHCLQRNASDNSSSEHNTVSKLQQLASMWTMYSVLAHGITSLIVIPFLSPMTDRLGRKWAMQLVCFGDIIKLTVNTAAIFLEWPVFVFVITNGFAGATGGLGLLLSSAFSYLADISTAKQRPFRITFAECSFGLVGVVTEVSIGYLLKVVPYQWPYVIAIGASVLNLMYVTFILPKVRERRTGGRNLLEIKRILKAFTAPGRHTAAMACVIVGFFFFTLQSSSSSVQSDYELGLPFCWDSVTIGTFSAAKVFGYNVGMLTAAALFTKLLGLSPLIVAIFGMVSAVSTKLMIGLARSSLTLFCTSILGLFSLLPIPMSRTYLSLQVTKDEQGAIFASISLMQIAVELFSSVSINLMYNRTVAWFPGFTFLIAAGFGTISLLFLLLAWFLHRRRERQRRKMTNAFDNINETDHDKPL